DRRARTRRDDRRHGSSRGVGAGHGRRGPWRKRGILWWLRAGNLGTSGHSPGALRGADTPRCLPSHARAHPARGGSARDGGRRAGRPRDAPDATGPRAHGAGSHAHTRRIDGAHRAMTTIISIVAPLPAAAPARAFAAAPTL